MAAGKDGDSSGIKRETDGRFAKGTKPKAGPGNPHLKRMRQYREQVERSIPAETCVKILQKFAVMAARDGDVMAGKVVLERLMGKPQAGVYPMSTLDISAPRTPLEAAKALRTIQESYAVGEISDTQAATHLALVRTYAQVFDACEMRRQICCAQQNSFRYDMPAQKVVPLLPARPKGARRQGCQGSPGRNQDRTGGRDRSRTRGTDRGA